MVNHDLSFVAPERRDEVLRRIAVVERFLEAPGRAAAETAAAELGLRPTQFYRLVRAWREHGKPDLLAGSSRPRPLRSLASSAQTAIVDLAATELPDAPVETVALRALALGTAAGVAMPALNSVRKIIEMRSIGRVSPSSPALGADIVVTTCAMDLAVSIKIQGEPLMPVATLVIDTASTNGVIGLALGLASPSASSCAMALQDALARVTPSVTPPTSSASLTMAVETRGNDAWRDLIASLTSAGLEVRETDPTPHSVMHDAVALLGRKPAGFRMMPGLTNRPPGLRRPSRSAPGAVLTLSDAEDLVRSRLIGAARPSPLDALSEDVRHDLAAKLADIAGR
jgi:hypothetical protein